MSTQFFKLSEEDLIRLQNGLEEKDFDEFDHEEEDDDDILVNNKRNGGATVELLDDDETNISTKKTLSNTNSTREKNKTSDAASSPTPAYSSTSSSTSSSSPPSLSSSSTSSSHPSQHQQPLTSAQQQLLFQEMLRQVALADNRDIPDLNFSPYGEEDDEDERLSSALASGRRGEDDEDDYDRADIIEENVDESFFGWLQHRVLGRSANNSTTSSLAATASKFYISTSTYAFTLGRLSFFLLSSGLVLALPLILANESEKSNLEIHHKLFQLERLQSQQTSMNGLPMSLPLAPGQQPPLAPLNYAPPPQILSGSGIPLQ